MIQRGGKREAAFEPRLEGLVGLWQVDEDRDRCWGGKDGGRKWQRCVQA